MALHAQIFREGQTPGGGIGKGERAGGAVHQTGAAVGAGRFIELEAIK